jgi:hypothetical protein
VSESERNRPKQHLIQSQLALSTRDPVYDTALPNTIAARPLNDEPSKCRTILSPIPPSQPLHKRSSGKAFRQSSGGFIIAAMHCRGPEGPRKPMSSRRKFRQLPARAVGPSVFLKFARPGSRRRRWCHQGGFVTEMPERDMIAAAGNPCRHLK